MHCPKAIERVICIYPKANQKGNTWVNPKSTDWVEENFSEPPPPPFFQE